MGESTVGRETTCLDCQGGQHNACRLSDCSCGQRSHQSGREATTHFYADRAAQRLHDRDCATCSTGREAARSTPRKSSLTTLDWYRLNRACEPVWDAFGGTYLVGTAATGGEYRDVDVRTILADEDFDRLFGGDRGRTVWTLLCTSIGTLLREATNMPIDYQIQRRTEANEKYPGGNRHPVGMVANFAGGGDATAFASVSDD